MKRHLREAATQEDASPAVPAKCTPPEELVQMAQNPKSTLHMRNWYQNMSGESGGTGLAQGESVFLLSTHQILTASLLSWGEYWLIPLLQSPENETSL